MKVDGTYSRNLLKVYGILFAFQTYSNFVTMSQVLHWSTPLGSTLFCTWLHAILLGSIFSAGLQKFSLSFFCRTKNLAPHCFRSQSARLWRWVTQFCFPTNAQSLGTGLVGLGSGFLTATRKLREFREVAGLAATVRFSLWCHAIMLCGKRPRLRYGMVANS